MTITLTGDNGFALKQELKRIKDDFIDQFGELALQQIDCSEASEAITAEALTSLPFLTSRKLIILRSFSDAGNYSHKLPELIEKAPATNDIVLVAETIDRRQSFYKFLKAKTDFKEFTVLDQAATINWLVNLAKDKGARISSIDARYLIERVGSSQERLSNELTKLILYRPEINRDSIDLLTDTSPASSIFELLEAAFAGNKKQVLKLYAEQRQLNVQPPQIISMLTWQLHILTVIRSAGSKTTDQIAKEAGLNPFVVRKSQTVARQLSLRQISNLVSTLLELDIKGKSTGIDLDDALQHYLLNLS